MDKEEWVSSVAARDTMQHTTRAAERDYDDGIRAIRLGRNDVLNGEEKPTYCGEKYVHFIVLPEC